MKGLRIVGNCIPVMTGRRIVRKHLEENARLFRRHLPEVKENGGFIEHQHALGDISYGFANMRHSGCEVIAVYNILHALTGKQPNLAKLIAAFEINGMILYGSLGTDPGEMKAFLKKRGFLVEEYTDPEEFLKEYASGRISDREAYVLTFYNDRYDLLCGIHTVAVTSNGRYLYLHNDGGMGARGPYSGIERILIDYDRRGAGMISILSVRKQ